MVFSVEAILAFNQHRLVIYKPQCLIRLSLTLISSSRFSTAVVSKPWPADQRKLLNLHIRVARGTQQVYTKNVSNYIFGLLS